MTREDEQLSLLVQAAEAARGRYIALALVNVTGSTVAIEGSTPEKLAEVAVAETSCRAADGALAEYRMVLRWGPAGHNRPITGNRR